MSLLRRLLDPAFRRARAAEAEGDYGLAARLYVEADAPSEAAKALLLRAVHAETLDERLQAYEAALRWLPPASRRARQVEGRMGMAILDDARQRGLPDAGTRARLRDGAGRLEAAGQPADAATAWELLGELEEAARCLVDAGDIDRLEELLGRRERDEARRDEVRRRVDDYEAHLATGARREAAEALRDALRVAPGDPRLEDVLRRLEARWLGAGRIALRIGAPDAEPRALTVVGRSPAVVGRAGADLVLRSPSVSRRHAAIRWTDGDPGSSSPAGFVLEDLDSRNGTLVHGVPLGAPLPIDGPLEVGVGADVLLRVTPEPPATGGGLGAVLVAEVLRGPDRGRGFVVVPPGVPFPLPGLPVRLRLGKHGPPALTPDPGTRLALGGTTVTTPVELLVDDDVLVLRGEDPVGWVTVTGE